MSEPIVHTHAASAEESIAEQLVRARLEARVLTSYPGIVPVDIAAGYRSQDAAIARWPEPIRGWKVTEPLSPALQAQCGSERLLGPAFASSVRSCSPGQIVDCPVFAGGLSGVEPEIVVLVGRDAPPSKVDWTIDEASDMVGELCIGAEILSSPLPTLTSFGMGAIAADFGCNFGIVVGSAVPNWRELNDFTAECFIDDELVGHGVASLRDGPLAAFAFTLANCARRGYPLQAGTAITTGTITRFHPIKPGQSSRLVFEGLGEIRCRAVEARPHATKRESSQISSR